MSHYRIPKEIQELLQKEKERYAKTAMMSGKMMFETDEEKLSKMKDDMYKELYAGYIINRGLLAFFQNIVEQMLEEDLEEVIE